MDYESAEEAARRWGVSTRWVQALCRGRRIPGAQRLGRVWLIPRGGAEAGRPAGHGTPAREAKIVNVKGKECLDDGLSGRFSGRH